MASPARTPRRSLPRRGGPTTVGLLGGVVLVALVLRLTGLTWGLPWVFHPDENHYVAVAQQMVRSGDPNPHYFENPSLLTYLIAGELLLLRGLGPPGLVEANATVLARLDGALLGTAGVVLVFLVGRRLFDRPVGLAAALFLAVAFLHVRDSHYGVNDVPATTVLTLALLLAARAAGRPTAARLALAGLAVGLAASTKYHIGLGLVLVPAAHWLGRRAAGRPLLDGPARCALAGAGLAAAGGYLLGTPYTLLDARGFLEGFLDQYATAGGRWFGQALEPVPLLYLTHLLQGFGALPLALAGAGLALGLRWRPAATALVAAFPAAYLAFMLTKGAFFARLAIPLLPFCALLAAVGTVGLARRLPPSGRRAGLVGLLAIALAQPLANDLLHNRIILQADTRVLANAWVQAELPPRSHLLVQTYTLLDVSRQYRTYTPNVARHRIELFLRGPRPDLLDSFVENDVDYFVASSFVYERDLLDPRRAVEPELRYRRLFHDLERRAPLVARFSPGRGGAEVPHSQESMFTPFWDLERYERPGPTLRIYALAPLAGRTRDGR
jgi:4-amino-4-deoxy-L-arabinose transferase-like glycosyltransferase